MYKKNNRLYSKTFSGLFIIPFFLSEIITIINYSKIVRRCRKIGILYYVQVQPSESKINCAVLHLLVK